SETHEHPEDIGPRKEDRHRTALEPLRERASYPLLDELPADVDQVPILHARGTRRLAVAAGETTVEMQLGSRGDASALEQLVHQVDPAARPVELVAEQLVRRAGRGAEPAVHALAEDRVRLLTVGRILDPAGEVGLHQRSAYIRPRLKTPCGSNSAFRRAWIRAVAGGSGWNTPASFSPPRNSVAWPPTRDARSRIACAGACDLSQRKLPPHSTRLRPSSQSCGVTEGTEGRQSGSSPAKNGSVCSRIPTQKRAACVDSTCSPPSF